MKNKAQIQGGETIAVVIIIVILVIIGIMVGSNRKIDDIQDEQKKIDYQNAMRIALKASNLQELRCTSIDNTRNACMDLLKIKSVSKIITQDTEAYIQYQEVFENTEINVDIIYPVEEKYTIYNYNDTANKSRFATFIPLLVMDPITGKNSFAMLEIATYS